ncbi:hypothetical protein SAMN04488109_1868 [Chryseolinea serpens]|uniref:Uncharacterized protein n=1 Tax=Chryseolinea serpens TaxID=947013 RepID=A0A1M5MPS2_9BACT|nr:hypothetical protein [Chryseolinea serpens]SHG79394.1 hypothetical protein SAMN04488109_1868 [Chryseolinea serpens]
MTKKDLFVLLIKIFGLYSAVISLFSVLPNNIMFAFNSVDLISIVWVVVSIAVVLGIFLILIFKANKIVELLKLDSGFEEERIDLGNLKSTDIIKIGTFVIGGFLIIDNVPGFLSHTFWSFKKEVTGMEFTVRDKFDWAVSGLNFLMGYLLMTNYAFVAKLFKEKNGIA